MIVNGSCLADIMTVIKWPPLTKNETAAWLCDRHQMVSHRNSRGMCGKRSHRGFVAC